MMELARGMAARIVGPFLTKKITDITRFWPMPFDEHPTVSMEDKTAEDIEAEKQELLRLADKWLKDSI